MEAILPLLIGLLSAGGIAMAWRIWSRGRDEAAARFDGRPSVTAAPRRMDGTSSPDMLATGDLVARMRDRPLEELGVGRALPRTARTKGICPGCGRTLDRGTRRCAGCGAWLVDGIPIRRAGAFVVRGLAIGVLIGLFGGLLLASLRAPDDPSEVASAAGEPSESIGPAPAGVRAALDGLVAVGPRLAAARDALAAALAEPQPDAASLAGHLRAVDAEAAEAVALTAALDRWPGSRELGADLRSFHVAVREAAAPGLRGDVTGARAAGSTVIESLTGLETLNFRTVEAARQIGLLPSAGPPASSPGPSAPAPPPQGESPAAPAAEG